MKKLGTTSLNRHNLTPVIATLMLAAFLGALDQTIVVTAIPTISGNLGGISHMSWIFTSYLLAGMVAVPLCGKLSDVYGRKKVFQVGLLIFLVGSSLAGVAQTINELIVFRAVQGIGAGALSVGVSALFADLVPARRR